jgi:hypothetical protein
MVNKYWLVDHDSQGVGGALEMVELIGGAEELVAIQ